MIREALHFRSAPFSQVDPRCPPLIRSALRTYQAVIGKRSNPPRGSRFRNLDCKSNITKRHPAPTKRCCIQFKKHVPGRLSEKARAEHFIARPAKYENRDDMILGHRLRLMLPPRPKQGLELVERAQGTTDFPLCCRQVWSTAPMASHVRPHFCNGHTAEHRRATSQET